MAADSSASSLMAAAKTSKKLVLSFSAKKLASFTATPTSAVTALLTLPNGAIVNIGRTELVSGQEVTWEKTILVEYELDNTGILLLVGDLKNASIGLLGSFSGTVSELIDASNSDRELMLQFHSPWCSGASLLVKAEEVLAHKTSVILHLSGTNLDKKDALGKSDPYFILRKELPGTTVELYKSEVVKKTLDPKWAPVTMSSVKLCNGSLERELSIEVWDWNKVMAHVLIGTVKTSWAQLLAEKELAIFQDEKKKAKGSNAGILNVSASERPEYSLLDFLAAGLKLNMVFGIDWTQSKNDKKEFVKAVTLHGRDGDKTQYTEAISAVLSALQPSMSSPDVAVYGTSGKMTGVGKAAFFPLSRNADKIEMSSAAQMIEEYFMCFKHVAFGDDSLLAPLIDEINKSALQSIKDITNTYTVLVLFSHGHVADYGRIIQELYNAATLPISIVLVGMGKSEFSNFKALDSPTKHGYAKSFTGESAVRDAFELITFDDCKKDPFVLKAALYEKLSQHILDYMVVAQRTPESLKRV